MKESETENLGLSEKNKSLEDEISTLKTKLTTAEA